MKKMSYKSSYIELRKENGKIVATIKTPQNTTEKEVFKNETDAKYWAISRAEYFDRKGYDYMY